MIRSRPILAALVLLLAGLCAAQPAYAATRVVNSLMDFPLPGVLSLREAISQSSPGDTIRFAVTGTIRLQQGPLALINNVIIEGPGTDKLSISGNNGTNVFRIDMGASPQISDLTITNGLASMNGLPMGAGVSNTGILTLTRCAVLGNRALAPPNDPATLNYRGGGIFNGGVLRLRECDISGNSAEFGGGIANFGLLDLRNTTVSGNRAADGAGIHSASSSFLAIGSTISGNIASGSGGGLYLQTSQINPNPNPTTVEAHLINCTLSGNTAQSGGGLHAQNVIVFVGSSTITDNDANVGGGVFNGGEVRVTSTIVADNEAGVGPDWSGTAFSEGSNLIGDTSGVVSNTNPNFIPGYGDFNWQPGLNDLLNVDANLGPLNNNGGPTRTHLPQSGSPAIDHAIVSINLGTLYNTYTITTDQRGLPRFADGDGVGSSNPDVGAVEVQSAVADLNGAANGSNYAAQFTEDGGPTAIVDSGLTITYPGGTTLASATVTLTNRPDGNLESLSATASGGISVFYNPATGELSLNGVAPLATYEQVLRSVKYNNLSQNPNTTQRSVIFSLYSGVSTGTPVTATIDVSAVNDAPVITVPGAQNTDEDTALVFSPGNGNAVSLADVDAVGNALEVALSVTNGTLSLSGTSGITFSAGDGTDDTAMTFTGTLTAVNAALTGLRFTPSSNSTGGATLSVITNDQGNSGSGGARTATSTMAITIGAINDAPINSVPAAQTTAEDTALVFSVANGNLVSIADVDVASNTVLVTLSATHGTLTLSGTTGLSFLTGDGSADSAMSFSGSLADVNAALNGLSFTPSANNNGAATLTVLSNDGGNAGAGGPQTDSDDIAITVTPVNDAPSAVDDSYAVNGIGVFTVDAPGVLSNDSDTEGSALTAAKVTDPAHGTLTFNSDGSFTYTPQSDYNGVDSFTYRVNDGALDSSVATVTLNVEGNVTPSISFVFPTANAVLNRLTRIAGVTSDRRNTVDVLIQRRSDRKYFDGISFSANRVLLPATVLADGRWILPGGLLPSSEELLDGSYILTAIATDVIGATTNQTIVFILDRQLPTVGITNPGPGARLTALKLLNGPVQDPAGGSGLDRVVVELRRVSDGFYWTGTQWSRSQTGLNAVLRGFTWTYGGRLPAGDDLRTGTYRVQVTAIDRAGNRALAQNTFSIITPGSANVSPIRLSGGAVQAQRGTVLLRFGGALNAASAVAPANYSVSVGGVAIAVESVSYNAATSLVTLQLGEGSVSSGDVLLVRYNLRDSAGRILTGQIGLTVR